MLPLRWELFLPNTNKKIFYCHYCHYCHKRPVYGHPEVAVVTVTYDFWYKNEQKQDKNISLSM